MKVDKPVLMCLAKLRCAEFAPLMQYLTDSRDELVEHLMYAGNDPLIHRLQGRLLALTDLLKEITNAPTMLDKLNR
jgi:hypothetical protein